MVSSLVILGRQPALGLAELESLYGKDSVQALSTQAALIKDAHQVDFQRLGGALKLCRVLGELGSTEWRGFERELLKAVPELLEAMPEGKVQLGISVYGLPIAATQILATGLTLKKAVRKQGRSVRLVPNNEAALSTAQTLHNHLTGPTGCELVVVHNEGKLVIAQVIAVQDITSYTFRDRGRPKRDARVGMLPPKLAQIIINLASGSTLPDGQMLLDPFCGTGVILQEAALLGYKIYATDLEKRMVDYTQQNLSWLEQHYNLESAECILETADATSHTWQQPIDLVASETYLGRPFTSTPGPEILAKTLAECNLIIKKFLQNLHGQLQPGARLCVAIPAWKKSEGFAHLSLLDSLDDLGYNRISFEHAGTEDLIYHRENQIVGRELLVLIRK